MYPPKKEHSPARVTSRYAVVGVQLGGGGGRRSKATRDGKRKAQTPRQSPPTHAQAGVEGGQPVPVQSHYPMGLSIVRALHLIWSGKSNTVRSGSGSPSAPHQAFQAS